MCVCVFFMFLHATLASRYFEEYAVDEYSKMATDSKFVDTLHTMKAPQFARSYYHLPADACFRDVLCCICNDEAHHRDTQHHVANTIRMHQLHMHKI